MNLFKNEMKKAEQTIIPKTIAITHEVSSRYLNLCSSFSVYRYFFVRCVVLFICSTIQCLHFCHSERIFLCDFIRVPLKRESSLASLKRIVVVVVVVLVTHRIWHIDIPNNQHFDVAINVLCVQSSVISTELRMVYVAVIHPAFDFVRYGRA